jgi:hypothetical protein
MNMSNVIENRVSKPYSNQQRVNKYQWMPEHVHGASLLIKSLYFASVTAYNYYRKNNLIKNVENVNIGLDGGKRNASVIEVTVFDSQNQCAKIDRWQYISTGEDSRDKHHAWTLVKTFGEDDDFDPIFMSITEAEQIADV